MRLREGDKVEVMNKNTTPFSWCGAKILSSNGHIYRVRYDSYLGMANEQLVETVSSTLIRPSPPLTVQGVAKCVNGDIVEVFFEFTWKLAAILRVLGGKKVIKSKKVSRNRYLVRLLGRSEELIFDESNIRMRQIWDDNKWVLIGKNSKDVIPDKPSTSTYYQKTNNPRAENKPLNDYVNVQDETAFLKSDVIHSRSLKRTTPHDRSILEAHNEPAKKIRAVEKIDNISTRYNREETELNIPDNDACSVGSCSVTGQIRNNFCIPFIPFPCRDPDTVSSDAESCYGSGSERESSRFLSNEELESRVRRLELHAYRKTLAALFACGPLSWEQEALLTNLRITLRISNDEHLMELKFLLKTDINFR